MARAAEVIQREKWKRLRSMTPEESLKIFSDLCEFAAMMPPGPGRIPEHARIKYLVERRAAFDLLSQRIQSTKPKP